MEQRPSTPTPFELRVPFSWSFFLVGNLLLGGAAVVFVVVIPRLIATGQAPEGWAERYLPFGLAAVALILALEISLWLARKRGFEFRFDLNGLQVRRPFRRISLSWLDLTRIMVADVPVRARYGVEWYVTVLGCEVRSGTKIQLIRDDQVKGENFSKIRQAVKDYATYFGVEFAGETGSGPAWWKIRP